jgi:hypothetical protein
MGVISTYSVLHKQSMAQLDASGPGGLAKGARSDNVPIKDKWQALVEQERYYQYHYGTTLHKYRETADIQNGSWNGAVKGWLKFP